MLQILWHHPSSVHYNESALQNQPNHHLLFFCSVKTPRSNHAHFREIVHLFADFVPFQSQQRLQAFSLYINCIKQDKRSEEHTSELQSRGQLVCRILLETTKKKDN